MMKKKGKKEMTIEIRDGQKDRRKNNKVKREHTK